MPNRAPLPPVGFPLSWKGWAAAVPSRAGENLVLAGWNLIEVVPDATIGSLLADVVTAKFFSSLFLTNEGPNKRVGF
jgi:hypothetical protein